MDSVASSVTTSSNRTMTSFLVDATKVGLRQVAKTRSGRVVTASLLAGALLAHAAGEAFPDQPHPAHISPETKTRYKSGDRFYEFNQETREYTPTDRYVAGEGFSGQSHEVVEKFQTIRGKRELWTGPSAVAEAYGTGPAKRLSVVTSRKLAPGEKLTNVAGNGSFESTVAASAFAIPGEDILRYDVRLEAPIQIDGSYGTGIIPVACRVIRSIKEDGIQVTCKKIGMVPINKIRNLANRASESLGLKKDEHIEISEDKDGNVEVEPKIDEEGLSPSRIKAKKQAILQRFSKVYKERFLQPKMLHRNQADMMHSVMVATQPSFVPQVTKATREYMQSMLSMKFQEASRSPQVSEKEMRKFQAQEMRARNRRCTKG